METRDQFPGLMVPMNAAQNVLRRRRDVILDEWNRYACIGIEFRIVELNIGALSELKTVGGFMSTTPSSFVWVTSIITPLETDLRLLVKDPNQTVLVCSRLTTISMMRLSISLR